MRHHSTARPFSRFALAALALCVLATGFVWPGRATPANAAATCPSDKANLIPWRGGRWLLSGVNVPWMNGGCGADFGTVEAWGQDP